MAKKILLTLALVLLLVYTAKAHGGSTATPTLEPLSTSSKVIPADISSPGIHGIQQLNDVKAWHS